MTATNHEAQQAEHYREIDELLAKKAGQVLNKGNAIEEYDGKQILKPTGMSPATHAKIAAEAAEEAAQIGEVHHIFKNARPYDGANALQLTLRRLYGMGGTGVTQMSFFGIQRPQTIEVEVDAPIKGRQQTIQVPWGQFHFLPLGDGNTPATITTDVAHDPEYGPVFMLTISGPAWKKPTYRGFFREVEETLAKESIYKGKCFVADSTGMNPQFFDPFEKVDPDEIVYNEDTWQQIKDTLIGPIRTAKWQRAKKIPLNIKVLLPGKYGTGKSSLLAILAQEAKKAGWTTLQTPAKATLDDVSNALRTAGQYASPAGRTGEDVVGALVLIEDVEQIAKRADDEDNRKLLELFDGLSVKNNEVMIVMTTNDALKMHRGMKRPGRTDQVIEIGDFDVSAIRRLLDRKLGHVLEQDVDFEKVHAAMEGYPPAFIMGTFVGAHRSATSRVVWEKLEEGEEPGLDIEIRLGTMDLVNAARGLQPLWEQHQEADEGEKFTIEKQLEESFAREFDTRVLDPDSGRLVKLNSQ